MYSNPCPSNWADEDFDPYQCGDTLLLPRQTYNDNATAFINVFKPPGLDDFHFVSIDDTIGADGNKLDDTPCWVANVYRSDSSSPAPRLSASWALTAGAVGLGLVLQSLLR